MDYLNDYYESNGLEVVRFPCLTDNYGYLIRDISSGLVACIDTPDAKTILSNLQERGWALDFILNTHHHPDHVGGNLELKAKTGAIIIGPAAESKKITGIDQAVSDGEKFQFGESVACVFDTPGHTNGHIVYHFADSQIAFVGDTLFALGCGRLFEGSPEQMWRSLTRIRSWPDETIVYCAHEYTEANLLFAETIETSNEALKKRGAWIRNRRSKGLPTVPFALGIEKETNPFLRADQSNLVSSMPDKFVNASPELVFTEIRSLKDQF